MNDDNIHITIKYMRDGEPDEQTIILSADEYFDLDEDEIAEIDSCPEHLDLLDYLDNPENVKFVSVNIEDRRNNKRRYDTVRYSDHQKSLLARRTEYSDKTVIYDEIIRDSLIDVDEKGGRLNELSRIIVEGENYTCAYHAIIRDNPDGSQSEFLLK